MFNSPLKHLDFKLSPSKISKNEWISVKRWLVENTSWKKTGEKDKKSQICFAGFQKRCIFAPEIKKGHQMSSKRCGSSAWLEYMPVTHGVAGSSPVRTAINIGNQCFTKGRFLYYLGKTPSEKSLDFCNIPHGFVSIVNQN